ncbi:succinate dehydrogenase, subunit C [Rhodnius prolixus]|uniref:Succinate dehydrogenase cytochrome b560 subunit, mitochondrial n=2 Tax=Rhodnius TaxID=13248 RepID=T1HBQ5_RHOPR
MALLRSVCSVGRKSISHPQVFRLPYLQARCVVLKASPATPPEVLGHDEKNAILGRPMSPHLTIYAPQLTSMMSISHRITGMALTGYAVVLAGASFFVDIAHVASAIQAWHLPIVLTFPLKFVLAFPAAYHLLNGIRHLVWDSGKALTLKEVYITGYGVLVATVLLSLYMASR